MNMVITAEISDALAARRPVVALESTIITHGMPYPQNLETTRAVEAAIRDAGAVPATIAVLDGTLHIGLAAPALDALAQRADSWKLSRADLAVAMATGRTGATTVSATMIAAHRAGITVFATGGIGGVHQGADQSFDISADLNELAQTPVTVVAAGAKAILDLPKTLEVLETLGVPVVTYQSDEFPAFWSRRSGLPAPCGWTGLMTSQPPHWPAQNWACRADSLSPIPSPRQRKSPPRYWPPSSPVPRPKPVQRGSPANRSRRFCCSGYLS